jgi:hypothetical protein
MALESTDIKDVMQALGEIKGLLTTSSENQKSAETERNKSNTKIMLTMLGVIAAQIGTKFINSPPWVIIGGYAAFFSGAFLIASVVLTRKNGLLENICRVSFACFVLYSTIVKLTVYEWGQAAPWWFGPGNDYIMAFLCLLFVVHAWRKSGY